MRALVQRVLQKYGTDAVVVKADSRVETKVFFHSSNSKSWQNMETLYCPLGQIPRGQYVCILPAGTAAAGDTLQIDGEEYAVCRAEDMLVGAEAVYQWSLCTGKGGEDTWTWEE